jgi:hypothetical protein
MIAVTNFRAHWQPQNGAFGIEIKLADGQTMSVPTPSAATFVAILEILNGPNPALFPDGSLVCER